MPKAAVIYFSLIVAFLKGILFKWSKISIIMAIPVMALHPV